MASINDLQGSIVSSKLQKKMHIYKIDFLIVNIYNYGKIKMNDDTVALLIVFQEVKIDE